MRLLERDVCIQEATGGKYGFGSEDVFRACMKTRGWARVVTHYPTATQFRGPEDADEFATPPNPLAKRYEQPAAEVIPCTPARRNALLCR